MDYGIPLGWPEVSSRDFDAALDYVGQYRREQYDVTVYIETRSKQLRHFGVQVGWRFYLHPELVEAMGEDMG